MGERVSTSIMVIGTDLHFCYLMQRYVRESDHPLLFAGPDRKALELVLREKPGLIVMEAGLPDADGRQMLKTLKANNGTCHIPVVLCSWHDEEQRPDESADAYLRMPILYSDFLEVLQDLGI